MVIYLPTGLAVFRCKNAKGTAAGEQGKVSGPQLQQHLTGKEEKGRVEVSDSYEPTP